MRPLRAVRGRSGSILPPTGRLIDSTVPSPLANQTIARIQQALESRASAGLPEVIKLIEELSSRAFSISVQELGDLISRDTMVTAKIIQAANTFGFNPFGGIVKTISQAIHIVGFTKIRNLALSMLLLENTLQGSHSEAQRESAALALCGGLLAQSLASDKSAQDPEQAFVFACLRQYGRLILTSFLPQEFEQVEKRPANESEVAASRRILGLSPLELTYVLFEASRFPREILRYMQDLPPARLAAASTGPEDEMAAIAQFSGELAELVVSPRITAAEFSQRAEGLRKTYGAKLELPEDAIAGVVQAVDTGLRAFNRSYGGRAISGGVLQRIAARVAKAEPALPGSELSDTNPTGGRVPPAVSTVAEAPVDAAAAIADGLVPAAAPAPPPAAAPLAPDGAAILTEALLQLTELMTADAIDLRAMESVALGAMQSALRLRDCLFFTRDGTKGAYAAQTGHGDLLGQIRGRPVIDATRRDVFGICLTRREDVLIRDTSDPKLSAFLPDWLMSAGTVRSFILLPLVGDAGVFALIVGTRSIAEPVHLNTREIQLLKAIRQHLKSARRIADLKT